MDIPTTLPLAPLEFINLKLFMDEYFERIPYVIVNENEDYFQHIANQELQTGIYIENAIIDLNLRVIDTYLPEYIHFICQFSNNGESIEEIIVKAAQNGPPHIPSYLRVRFLTRKLYNLLEAIIYSDFSDRPWNGKWINDRCFVLKRNGSLEYYTKYHYTTLIQYLISHLQVSCTNSISTKNAYRIILKL